MKAAILVIGDELTCGYQLDTNSQVISRRLIALPADVVLHMALGDDVDAIHAGLRVALQMIKTGGEPSALVIAGGLGPTGDDLTRQAIAAYFDLALEEDAQALAHIEERFARRGRTMPASNRIQAQVPAGSRVIYNRRGTAAGFYLAAQDGIHLFVTPGVPYEMEGMLEGFVLPRLRELVGAGRRVRRAVMKVYGLPESEINERIRPMLARDRNPLLGLLPNLGTITVEVVAAGASDEEALALLEADLAALRAELGQHVISEDDRDLPQVVTDLLIERGLTVAVAEVGTGGLVAARFTASEQAERCFRGGTVPAGAKGTPQELALTARETGLADVGVGVGGIVVPDDSTAERPYAALDVVVNVQGRETCRRLRFGGDGARMRQWAADGALALLRQCVLERDG